MIGTAMSSLERVLATLGHREPDRVPVFLLATMHGARALGLGIREYFARAGNVVRGQLRLRELLGHDCLYAFLHASLELEAWGGETVFRDDGPPNAGQPVVARLDDLARLEPPSVATAACLRPALEAISGLAAAARGEVPVIGVVLSPASLPILQLGFPLYLELLTDPGRRALLDRLLAANERFCADWAGAQVRAGATAICYFDPASSPTVVPPELYRTVGGPSARRVLPRIPAPTATHFASGRCLAILDDVRATGTLAVGVGPDEDLAEVKRAAAGRLGLLGNLNGVAMRRWSASDAEAAVKAAIAAAGAGGGFILSDAHGEIPFQVPEDTLLAIAEAARRWGRYPLAWAP